jgi:hypothetical protein
MEGSGASVHPETQPHSSSAQLPAKSSATLPSSRSTPPETPYVPKRSSSAGATSAFAAAAAAGPGAGSDTDAGSSPTVRRLSGYSGVITRQASPLLSLSRASSTGDTMPVRRSPLCHAT